MSPRVAVCRRGGVGACALVLGVACAGKDWVVGEELPRGSGGGAGAPSSAQLAVPDSCASAQDLLALRASENDPPSVLEEHIGRWRGTLSDDPASAFPGADVSLALDASGAGTLSFDAAPETVSAGEVDPGAGYLCHAGASGVECGTASGFVGKFSYPLASARSRGSVLSFVLQGADPWNAWCALQAPVSWPDANRSCGFDFGVRSVATPHWSPLGCTRETDADAEPIDCALMYALERCQCARDACFARFDAGIDVGLTLSEDGQVLSGSLWTVNGDDAAFVLLRRVP